MACDNAALFFEQSVGEIKVPCRHASLWCARRLLQWFWQHNKSAQRDACYTGAAGFQRYIACQE